MEKSLGRQERYSLSIQAAIERVLSREVKWGKDDCLMFLADIVREVEGVDTAAPRFRGHYRSASGALRLLGRGGVPGAVARAARRIGFKPMPAALAPIGSLGLIQTASGPAGAMRHEGLWITRAPVGFSAWPSRLIFKAWGYECRL